MDLSLIFGIVAYIWIYRLYVPGLNNGLVLMRFFITYRGGGLNFVAYIWIGRLYLVWSLIFGLVAYVSLARITT